jgi:hypothetical protein
MAALRGPIEESWGKCGREKNKNEGKDVDITRRRVRMAEK